MKFFSGKNNVRKYKVMKLFKIANLNEAFLFDFKKCTTECLEYIKSRQGSYPNSFEVNYGKMLWKSKEGFMRGISIIENKDLVILMANYSNCSSYLKIENAILNFTLPPLQSSIIIEIAIESVYFDDDSLLIFLKKIYNYLHYDYGYITELDESYDFETERKINKTLFGSEIKIEEADHTWRFHMLGIKEGYIKQLHLTNLINKSQLEQPVIGRLLQNKVGQLNQINENITLWSLNPSQFELANKELKASKYLMNNSDNPKLFLDTHEARSFYEKMKLVK